MDLGVKEMTDNSSELMDWESVHGENPDTPASRSGRRRWQKKYDFPAPIYLTPNHPRWYRCEVDEWFRTRSRSYLEVIEQGRKSIRQNEASPKQGHRLSLP
jgi:hypothetical protein